MEGAPNIKALLRARRDELIHSLERLRKHVKDVEDELDEIEKAATAIGMDFSKIENTSFNLDITKRIIKAMMKTKSDFPTIKEAAVAILKDAEPGGMTANEILEKMKTRFHMSYSRSSLSPQLSRLKDEQVIALTNGRWALEAAEPVARNLL